MIKIDSQVVDVTSKLELAERMAGRANAPKQALESIFQGVIMQLETQATTTFESSMKEKVWDAVSPEPLKKLKEAFLLEFCDKILGRFDDKEASEMLEEHKRTGLVKNTKYKGELQRTCNSFRESIIDFVCEKADSMTNSFTQKIIESVKKEGVKFSEIYN